MSAAAARRLARFLPTATFSAKRPVMEELFGNPAYRRFTLQDKKRLPARFFARLAGARTGLLG